MSASLRRGMQVLYALAAQGDRPRGTRAVAAAVGLPAATTARLLADLRSLGFAEQVSARGPWRLGPACHSLALRFPYRSAITEALKPAMYEIADTFSCGVVLTSLRGDHRITLGHYIADEVRECGFSDQNILAESWDVWSTAGGRVLAAALTRSGQRALVDAIGLPGRNWPGILTRQELYAELKEIRRQGYASCRALSTWSIAVAVDDSFGGHVSFGCYWPDAPTLAIQQRVLSRLEERSCWKFT